MMGDGPWWVVIDLHRPYSGGEIQQEPGVIRIPFATGESAERAAGEITVSVRCVPAVIQGAVIGEQQAIGECPHPAGQRQATRAGGPYCGVCGTNC